MAHTNSTQYYNLPQFIGTDVPGWLTDVNQGYAAIDAGMRAAQVKADQADQTAGQAANDVQSLGTTVTTQASQIAAAAQSASSAQSAANAADAKADANTASIAGLDDRVTALEQSGGNSGGFSECGSFTSSGETRTLTLQGQYSSMDAIIIQAQNDTNTKNGIVPCRFEFTAPSTVTFKIAANGAYATSSQLAYYAFKGQPAI